MVKRRRGGLPGNGHSLSVKLLPRDRRQRLDVDLEDTSIVKRRVVGAAGNVGLRAQSLKLLLETGKPFHRLTIIKNGTLGYG